MNTSASPTAQVVFLRTADILEHISGKLLYRAQRAGWVAPLTEQHNFTLWPDNTLAVIKEKLATVGYPPPLPCELAARARQRERVAAKGGVSRAN